MTSVIWRRYAFSRSQGTCPSTVASPAVGIEEPGEHLQRGRLAGAVRSEEPDDLARRDVEGDPLDGDDILGLPLRRGSAPKRAALIRARGHRRSCADRGPGWQALTDLSRYRCPWQARATLSSMHAVLVGLVAGPWSRRPVHAPTHDTPVSGIKQAISGFIGEHRSVSHRGPGRKRERANQNWWQGRIQSGRSNSRDDWFTGVGDTGLEPVTSTMSTWRSNQLS